MGWLYARLTCSNLWQLHALCRSAETPRQSSTLDKCDHGLMRQPSLAAEHQLPTPLLDDQTEYLRKLCRPSSIA